MAWLAGLALALCAGAQSAMAASDHRTGDGSDTDNPALRPTYQPQYEAGWTHPSEPYAPSVNIDWSVGLRGAYTSDKQGGRYELQLLPSISASHDGGRWTWNGSASATLVRQQDGQARIAALRLSTGGDYALDPATTLTGNAALSITQASSTAFGTASNVLTQPIVVSGALDGAVSRDLGRITLTLRGSLDRAITGPTTLTDLTQADNASQNSWSYGAGLRVGYEMTPIWTLFADAGAERQVYDRPSQTLLVPLDGTTYTLKTGVTGQWDNVLTLEGSVGVALKRFDAASLSNVQATLFDGRIVFRPDPTWTLTGTVSSSIDAPGSSSPGSARINYAAIGEVAYQVNRWLSLRGSVGWRQATTVGTTTVETGTDLTLGADYRLNAHTALTADYTFSRNQATPNPAEDSHVIGLGIRLSR